MYIYIMFKGIYICIWICIYIYIWSEHRFLGSNHHRSPTKWNLGVGRSHQGLTCALRNLGSQWTPVTAFHWAAPGALKSSAGGRPPLRSQCFCSVVSLWRFRSSYEITKPCIWLRHVKLRRYAPTMVGLGLMFGCGQGAMSMALWRSGGFK